MQSPFSIMATFLPNPSTNSTISFSRPTSALSLGLMFLVRQCIVRQLMPVFTIRSTSFKVSSCDGSKRILAEMLISVGMASRRAVRIEQRRSGVDKRAAPIPECVEKDLGQPQLRSIPETSFMTARAALTAYSGSADPIWYIRKGFSIGCVVNTAFDTPW